jgi:gamma-glutamyltranspeptidase
LSIASKSIAFTVLHYAANQAAQNILQRGKTAIEAMVASAASIWVIYLQMGNLDDYILPHQ